MIFKLKRVVIVFKVAYFLPFMRICIEDLGMLYGALKASSAYWLGWPGKVT